MYQLILNIPEETALALKLDSYKLRNEVLLAAAMKLYELGKLSSGVTANLAGIPRVLFLSKLSDYGVNTFSLTEAELSENLAST